VALEILGVLSDFFELMFVVFLMVGAVGVAVLLSSVKIGGMDKGGPGMRSQGVSKFYISGSFPNTSGEYMLRRSEDGKMVIGPSMWSEDDRNADI
jgi:hypothetical protein